MKSIRRTAVRALLGFAAAVAVGFAGASAVSAQPVDQASRAVVAYPSDIAW